jgi:hypothetical protein
MRSETRRRLYGYLFVQLCIYLLTSTWNRDAANAAWPSDPLVSLPICTAAGSQYDPRLIRTPDGYIVVWQDERRISRDIYAQKLDANGAMKWADNGRVIAAGNNGEASNSLIHNSQSLSGIVSDTQGGAIVLWTEDYSCGSGPCGNAWITRVHSDSGVHWGMLPSPAVTIQGTDTAVLLNTHASADAIAPDGEGGAFLIFGVNAAGSWYVYRLDANGACRSATSNIVGSRSAPRIIYGGNSNGKGYANIAWWDYGDFAIQIEDPEVAYPASTDILYPTWNKVTLTSTPAWWSEPSVISDGAGGMIVAWTEDSGRNGDNDIFAQKIAADGTVQWTPTGVPIAVQPGRQRFQQLVSDGAGGAVVVWEDWRASPTRVYAQHIGADGNAKWAENGIPVSSTYGESPKIIRSYDGAYVVAWVDTDHNGGTKDYFRVQKISPAGSLLWPIDSRTESGDTTGTVIGEIYGTDFDIVSDGGGGLIAAWALWGDIYAKKVAPDTPQNLFDTVQKLYLGYYQRPADAAGLLFWANALGQIDTDHTGIFSRENILPILHDFAFSDEARSLYNGNITSANIADVVNSIYRGLFNRDADPGGLAFYVNGFSTGGETPATILWSIMNGAQNNDLLTITNKVTAALSFTRAIDPDSDGLNLQVTYAGNIDAQKARDFIAAVTSEGVTIPTADQISVWMKNNIADPGDKMLSR